MDQDSGVTTLSEGLGAPPLNMPARHKGWTVAGVAFALGFPALPIARWEHEFASTWHLIAYDLIWWAAIAGLLFYVLIFEGRAPSSVGFRKIRVGDVAVGLAGGVVALAGLGTIFFLIFPLLHVSEGQQLHQLTATPLWWRLASVARAAVGEEVLFRGYAITRIRDFSGSLSLAAWVSWAIFTVEHVEVWGWGHLLIAGFGGAVLTSLFIWRKNIWVSIFAHAIVDGVAVLL